MFYGGLDAVPPCMLSEDLLQSLPVCFQRIYCSPSLYVFSALSLAKA